MFVPEEEIQQVNEGGGFTLNIIIVWGGLKLILA